MTDRLIVERRGNVRIILAPAPCDDVTAYMRGLAAQYVADGYAAKDIVCDSWLAFHFHAALVIGPRDDTEALRKELGVVEVLEGTVMDP